MTEAHCNQGLLALVASMRFSILAVIGLAAACLIPTAATAADLVVDTPMAAPASASGWDGFHAGIQSGYDVDGFLPIQGVVGVNMTVSEAFLIGVELAGGPYLDVGGGGGPGYEGYLAGRAGVPVGPPLLCGMAGVSWPVCHGRCVMAGVADADAGFDWLVG